MTRGRGETRSACENAISAGLIIASIAPKSAVAPEAVGSSMCPYELSVVKRNHGAPVDPLRLRYHEGALMPVEALPDDGKLEAGRQAVVREAMAMARVNTPLNRHKRHPDVVFKNVGEAVGRRPSKTEIDNWLSEATRRGELVCVPGAKGQTAGYYPSDDAYERAREAHKAGRVKKD